MFDGNHHKKELIPANEARRMTEDGLETLNQAVWDGIVDGIDKAIEDGQFYYDFAGLIPDTIVTQFQELGYDVTTGRNSFGLPYTRICW